jgi:hypothetical protein
MRPSVRLGRLEGPGPIALGRWSLEAAGVSVLRALPHDFRIASLGGRLHPSARIRVGEASTVATRPLRGGHGAKSRD